MFAAVFGMGMMVALLDHICWDAALLPYQVKHTQLHLFSRWNIGTDAVIGFQKQWSEKCQLIIFLKFKQ